MDVLILGLFLLISFALCIISALLNFNAPLIAACLLMLFASLNVMTTGYSQTVYSEIYEYGSDHGTPTRDNTTFIPKIYKVQTSDTTNLGLILFGVGIALGIAAIRPQAEPD